MGERVIHSYKRIYRNGANGSIRDDYQGQYIDMEKLMKTQ